MNYKPNLTKKVLDIRAETPSLGGQGVCISTLRVDVPGTVGRCNGLTFIGVLTTCSFY